MLLHCSTHAKTVTNGRDTWCRRVGAQCTIPPDVSTLGLHAFGLTIHSVAINGTNVSFNLLPYQWESLPASVLEATASKLDAAYQSAAEDSASEYMRFLRQEQQPELIIHVCSALHI